MGDAAHIIARICENPPSPDVWARAAFSLTDNAIALRVWLIMHAYADESHQIAQPSKWYQAALSPTANAEDGPSYKTVERAHDLIERAGLIRREGQTQRGGVRYTVLTRTDAKATKPSISSVISQLRRPEQASRTEENDSGQHDDPSYHNVREDRLCKTLKSTSTSELQQTQNATRTEKSTQTWPPEFAQNTDTKGFSVFTSAASRPASTTVRVSRAEIPGGGAGVVKADTKGGLKLVNFVTPPEVLKRRLAALEELGVTNAGVRFELAQGCSLDYIRAAWTIHHGAKDADNKDVGVARAIQELRTHMQLRSQLGDQRNTSRLDTIAAEFAAVFNTSDTKRVYECVCIAALALDPSKRLGYERTFTKPPSTRAEIEAAALHPFIRTHVARLLTSDVGETRRVVHE